MMSAMTRRDFAAAIGGTWSAALSLPSVLSWGAPNASSNGSVLDAAESASGLCVVRQTAQAFGAEGSLLILHPEEKIARRAAKAAVAELEKVEEFLSLYRPESEICRLNQAGVLARPHPYLVNALRKSLEMSAKSAGAFDVTVQPLWELYEATKKSGRIPTSAELESARGKVDWRQIEVTADEIRLKRRGMKVTLNAMAQGFAADRVLSALRAHGISQALVNTGEIGAMGRRADGKPWTIGIQHPRRKDAFVALANLENCCMATSGDYASAFDDDYLRHHIFDPATGQSPRELSSVTITAPSGTDADALSTTVFVLGAENGLRLLAEFPKAEAFLVRKDGGIIKTRGFPEVQPEASDAGDIRC
ncbi:MAG: FAD:protein FMN transferase [Verrucomicrobia bacterium]|nr:FAD:protein FMN transferase [Verrucomicrobiota bacterium]